VTFILNALGEALADVTFKVELPTPFELSVTVPGLRFVEGPGGEDAVRVTVPENPFRLVRVMADVPEDPWAIVKEVGFADRVKSGAAVIW
jgi:hypothetical protein